MKSHRIAGGGGIQLHVVDTGNENGQPILFLHGFSQSRLAWSRQLNSDLARDCRLVAVDLRGHGLSEKPRDGYADSRLWADDVDAVIGGLGLDHPIVCGWSYGPLVILDYVRHYGDGDIGGLNFVGGVTKLGSEEAIAVLTPEFLGLIPGFYSTNVEESVRSMESLLRLCFARDVAAEDMYMMLGYNVSVPPFVRQGLFSRSLDNDDVLSAIEKPVLITHGERDAVVKPAIVDWLQARLGHAEVHVIEGAGHAAFWDDAAAYNQRLRTFAESVQGQGSSTRSAGRNGPDA